MIALVADRFAAHPEALGTWVAQAEVYNGKRPRSTTSEAPGLATQERKYTHLVAWVGSLSSAFASVTPLAVADRGVERDPRAQPPGIQGRSASGIAT
jgi:hypothetical protein